MTPVFKRNHAELQYEKFIIKRCNEYCCKDCINNGHEYLWCTYKLLEYEVQHDCEIMNDIYAMVVARDLVKKRYY